MLYGWTPRRQRFVRDIWPALFWIRFFQTEASDKLKTGRVRRVGRVGYHDARMVAQNVNGYLTLNYVRYALTDRDTLQPYQDVADPRPIDGVPWEIHRIEDPEARGAAYEAYRTTVL